MICDFHTWANLKACCADGQPGFMTHGPLRVHQPVRQLGRGRACRTTRTPPARVTPELHRRGTRSLLTTGKRSFEFLPLQMAPGRSHLARAAPGAVLPTSTPTRRRKYEPARAGGAWIENQMGKEMSLESCA